MICQNLGVPWHTRHTQGRQACMFSPCSAKRRASDKDLPVNELQCTIFLIVRAWMLQNLESRDWHIKLKHFLTCIVCIKNALFDDNVNALTSLPASSLAPSYITRQSVSQPHASMPKQRLICMLFFPLHSSCAKLWNQVPCLDHFVVQNSGDFLCWKYKEVVCFYVSNLRQ